MFACSLVCDYHLCFVSIKFVGLSLFSFVVLLCLSALCFLLSVQVISGEHLVEVVIDDPAGNSYVQVSSLLQSLSLLFILSQIL